MLLNRSKAAATPFNTLWNWIQILVENSLAVTDVGSGSLLEVHFDWLAGALGAHLTAQDSWFT